METPKSIRYFEQLYLVSLFLGLIQGASIVNILNLNIVDEFFLAGFQFIALLISGVLVLLTSRLRSRFFKWVITLLFILSLAVMIPSLAFYLEQGTMGYIAIVQIAMQAIAIYLLFTPESNEWFSYRASVTDNETDTDPLGIKRGVREGIKNVLAFMIFFAVIAAIIWIFLKLRSNIKISKTHGTRRVSLV